MRRFVIFLLLCVLPLQFALAGAVDALEHGREAHFQSAPTHSHAAPINNPDTDGDSSSVSHGECGGCHFVHSLAFFGERPLGVLAVAEQDISPINRADNPRDFTGQRPDRPQWLQLA